MASGFTPIVSLLDSPSPEPSLPRRANEEVRGTGGEVSSAPRRVRRFFDLAVILVFAAAVGAVLYGTTVREQPAFDENRPRHPPPPLSAERHALQDYPRWFDMYLGDRVGYRDVLLDWHQRALYDGLGEREAGLAWVGDDGWLYLNVADPDRYKDQWPPLGERVEAWADEFAARREYLKGRGIEYVVMIAPEKSSVYPEHLPAVLKRRLPPEPTVAVCELLAARGVRGVNPLPALLAAKGAGEPVYYPQDTHWTQAGGRAAYAELAKELRAVLPGWEPLADDGYAVREEEAWADLRRFVPTARRLDDTSPTYTATARAVQPHPDPPFADALPKECRPPRMAPVVYTCEDAPGPAAVLFRDSFGEGVVPFAAADFRRAAVVVSDTLEPAVLDAERPAVVIQVMVARKLYLTTPPPRRYTSR